MVKKLYHFKFHQFDKKVPYIFLRSSIIWFKGPAIKYLKNPTM